jgi:hypothetical protein
LSVPFAVMAVMVTTSPGTAPSDCASVTPRRTSSSPTGGAESERLAPPRIFTSRFIFRSRSGSRATPTNADERSSFEAMPVR